jgi:hypothetical protein
MVVKQSREIVCRRGVYLDHQTQSS